jgi:hypothetical protein
VVCESEEGGGEAVLKKEQVKIVRKRSIVYGRTTTTRQSPHAWLLIGSVSHTPCLVRKALV